MELADFAGNISIRLFHFTALCHLRIVARNVLVSCCLFFESNLIVNQWFE